MQSKCKEIRLRWCKVWILHVISSLLKGRFAATTAFTGNKIKPIWNVILRQTDVRLPRSYQERQAYSRASVKTEVIMMMFVTEIIHLIWFSSYLTPSCSPFLSYTGISVLASHSVPAPTPLSLRLSEHRSTASGSWRWVSRVHPAQHPPPLLQMQCLEAQYPMGMVSEALAAPSQALCSEAWELSISERWAAKNNMDQCFFQDTCNTNFRKLSSKSKPSCFPAFLTFIMDFSWVSRMIKLQVSPTDDSSHTDDRKMKGRMGCDKCKTAHWDDEPVATTAWIRHTAATTIPVDDFFSLISKPTETPIQN